MNSDHEGEGHPLKHDHLPNPSGKGFRAICIARSGSGKSNLIKNILTRPEFGYLDYYGPDGIFIISETLGLDKVWDSLDLPQHHKMSKFDPEVLEEAMEYASKRKRGALFVLDDCICNRQAFNAHSPQGTIIDKLYMMGRHHKCSVITTSQRYFSVPPKIRVNSSCVIAFKLANETEKKQFCQDHAFIKDFESKFDYATKERYSFVYIDKERDKLYRNFTEELV